MHLEDWEINVKCPDCDKDFTINLIYGVIEDLSTDEMKELRNYIEGQIDLYGGSF